MIKGPRPSLRSSGKMRPAYTPSKAIGRRPKGAWIVQEPGTVFESTRTGFKTIEDALPLALELVKTKKAKRCEVRGYVAGNLITKTVDRATVA